MERISIFHQRAPFLFEHDSLGVRCNLSHSRDVVVNSFKNRRDCLLQSKHLLQHAKDFCSGSLIEATEFPCQSDLVNSSNLVEDDLSLFFLKGHRDA